MRRCFECQHDNEDNAGYCVKCGTPLDPKEYSRVLARRGNANSQPQPRAYQPRSEAQPVNKFDEGVRDFFTSRTFKTLLTLGLGGACCIGLIYLTIAGTMLSFFKVLFGQ